MSDNKSPQKILFISPQPFFTERGSPYRVQATVSSIASLGFEVDLLVFPLGRDVTISGVNIHRPKSPLKFKQISIGPSWRKIYLDLLLAIKAWSLTKTNQYVAIHGVEESAFIARFLARRIGVPYIVDMHSLLPEHLGDTNFIRSKTILKTVSHGYNKLLSGAGGIMTVADELTAYALTHAPEIQALTIEDLPLENLNSEQGLVEEICDRYNLRNKTVLTYTGNFKEYQGIGLLLESFALFTKRYGKDAEKFVLLIVGGDTNEELAEYKARAEELSIPNRCVFTGCRPSTEMGAFMKVSDALISPRTLGGNTPLKVYSYMAAERPIIATRISSHTQVLNDSSAFLRNASVEDFSEVFADYLRASKEEISQKVKNAKEIVDSRYNRKLFTEKLASLYSFAKKDETKRAIQQNALSAIYASSLIVGDLCPWLFL